LLLLLLLLLLLDHLDRLAADGGRERSMDRADGERHEWGRSGNLNERARVLAPIPGCRAW